MLCLLRLRTRQQWLHVPCRSMSTLQDKTFQLKTPKGTRDYNEKEMTIRHSLFSTITNIFQRHGAVTIDTPVFEMRNILSGKYGEDSKLIYDLANQGGEDYSLRYDLTVPFARYLAMQGKKDAQQIKRYQIAKVYRRDQPVMTKGRLREFYQCDFDIAGVYDPMLPDAEILKVLCETLEAVEIPFKIKLNHRQILDGIFQVCGVEPDHIRSISSAVDKMDKLSWKDVKKEMVHEKGLEESKADHIGNYVEQLKGKDTTSLLQLLEKDELLMKNEGACKGIADIKLLLDFLDVLNVKDRVQLDLSLARGLDYYTGIIYEAIQTESTTEGSVGSIAAGGRYDNLVGMFSGTNKNGKPKTIPCVGVSIGVERLFSILMSRQDMNKIKSNATQVYIISVGDGLLKERMSIVNELWKEGINASFMLKNKPKLEKQWAACEKDQIPFAVILGKDELDKNQIRIKDMRLKDKSQGGGSIIHRSDMVQELKSLLFK